MKRLWIVVLALLLLSGCGNEPPADTTESTETEPTEKLSLYVPGSEVEQATNGAVRTYRLVSGSKFRLEAMGSKLLLRTDTELSVLMGADGEVVATMLVSDDFPEVPADISAMGVAYMDRQAKRVTVRNPQLLVSEQVDFPAECEGTPIVSISTGELYYVSGQEIRAMNMETGISRLIKQQSCKSQTLFGCWFDGAMLGCYVKDEKDVVRTVYLSTQTGQTLSEDQTVQQILTDNDRFFAIREDGQVTQEIVGTKDGAPQLFVPTTVAMSAIQFQCQPVPALNGAVEYGVSMDGLHLIFCDFSTGKAIAQVMLPGVGQSTDFCSDGTSLWFFADSQDGGVRNLYRWDMKASPVAKATPCLYPLYTADRPDTEGLALCQARVDVINKTHSVRISIWQDVLEHIGDLAVTAEYQTSVITEMLNQIEPILSQFPGNFLRKTVESGWIRICLVRDLPEEKTWLQIWDDGDCCVLLTPEADIQTALLSGIGYGIDSHILGNSRDFDTWSALNPEGFVYLAEAEGEVDASYLEGATRYFVDREGAQYPHWDRSGIFCQAMLPDNVKLFAAPGLQAKLLRICQGIREAYGLEKSTDTYPWEQYLVESIAYKE